MAFASVGTEWPVRRTHGVVGDADGHGVVSGISGRAHRDRVLSHDVGQNCGARTRQDREGTQRGRCEVCDASNPSSHRCRHRRVRRFGRCSERLGCGAGNVARDEGEAEDGPERHQDGKAQAEEEVAAGDYSSSFSLPRPVPLGSGFLLASATCSSRARRDCLRI